MHPCLLFWKDYYALDQSPGKGVYIDNTFASEMLQDVPRQFSFEARHHFYYQSMKNSSHSWHQNAASTQCWGLKWDSSYIMYTQRSCRHFCSHSWDGTVLPQHRSHAPGAALLPRGSAWPAAVPPFGHRAGGHALTQGHRAEEGVRIKKYRLSIVTLCIHRSQIELNSFKISESSVMMSQRFWV